ncbi:cysteine proteinase [Lactarius indigo]|nr:cysteine proteinase [Lactarius indigo]
MPSVTVLPPSPPTTFPSSSTSAPSTLPNGSPRPFEDMSVSEIKERAIQQAQRASRGSSAISLIRSAKGQISLAQSCESAGDLKGALSAFTKAASLTQVFMDTADFKAESVPGKRGVLWKEFTEFQQREGSDLMQRAHAIESKLSQVEKSAATQLNGHHPSPPLENGVQKVSGGSIADRMRSLQDAGLSVSTTTKRVSREIPTTLSIPLSPTSTSSDSTRTIRNSLQSLGLSSPTISHSTSSSSKVSSPPPPVHSFVSPSAFGPPSPTSSASSSPRTSFLTPVEFSQAFPSIDELEEIDGRRAMADVGLRSDSSGSSDSKSTPWPGGSTHPPGDHSPNIGTKSFPVLPVDLGTRPSSTPITPVVDHFASRPASPVKRTLGIRGSSSPLIPSAELHVKNMAGPRELYDYMYRHELKVLMLDVRTREAFDYEHIRGDAVVCIEPSVLLRDNVSGQTIEDSLTVAPRDEWVLFCNRDKFDLIAIYDDASETPGPPDAPLSRLEHAIYETAFRKILKRVPVLLIGGLEAWKREFGERELVVAEASVLPPALPPTEVFVPPSPQPQLPHVPRSPPGVSVTSPTLETFRALPPVPRNPPPVSDIRPPLPLPDNYPHRSFDQGPASPRLPEPRDLPSEPIRRLQRKPTMTRPPSVSSLNALPRTMSEGTQQASPTIPPPMTNGPIQYPQIARTLVPHNSGLPFNGSAGSYGLASPPQASLYPSSLSRRRSEYHDQSQESLTLTGAGFASRAPIDYPDLSAQHILRPPPVAAAPKERPRTHAHSFSVPATGPPPPTIPSEYPVTYWSDFQIGISGLKNLGNTCYMNSTIQCLSATVPFARFFTDGRWKSAVNMVNPLGTKGNIVHAFSGILHDLWHGEMPYITPYQFRRSICLHASQFGGTEQHDSQEFLSFLLDGLHEDLNRILNKPTSEVTASREEELEKLPQQIASEQEWKIYRMRNDSIVVDFFQGQFRNRLECLTCHKTSTTYNSFMYLSLPIPSTKTSKVDIQQCLDAFVRTEVMEKSDAWNCPRCKTLRKATKTLSLSRLPPVLLIHFKRFSFKGPFTDKIEKHIDFPLKGLDLTNYMPPPLPPGVDRTGMQMHLPDDPRSQIPPYRYDLYAVTNHFGSLSSGHYTAFIASRGGWLYCDDSRVTPANAKEVVGKPAYVLYYKRVKA